MLVQAVDVLGAPVTAPAGTTQPRPGETARIGVAGRVPLCPARSVGRGTRCQKPVAHLPTGHADVFGGEWAFGQSRPVTAG